MILLAGAVAVLVVGAVVFATTRDGGHRSGSSSSSSIQVAAVNSVDRILASMHGLHEGTPHGVPSSYSWVGQPVLGATTPPSGMGAINGWGQIYADSSDVHPANVRVEIRNIATFVFSAATNAWVRVQFDSHVDGAHYVEDFTGNTSVAADLRAEPDGGTSTDMIEGHNFHFWAANGRGSLADSGAVTAVYTSMEARVILDDPNGPDNRSQARYLANMGADWWRDLTIGFGDGSNNPGVGQSRFTYLTSDWTAIDFYTGGPTAPAPGSWTEDQLRASPPPLDDAS